MQPNTIRRVLAAYGIDDYHISPVQKGYRNMSYPVTLQSGAMLNLILYKDEPHILPRIRRANGISNFLALQGLPVRRSQGPVTRLHGNSTRYAALYDYLPGETIPWEAYGKDHIKLLGKTMSLLHTLARDYKPSAGLSLPDVIGECETLLGRMERYFEDDGVIAALAGKLRLRFDPLRLAGITLLLDVCRQLPDRQPLHMDFVRGNILFGQDWQQSDRCLFLDDAWQPPYISGILDFEKVSMGPPVFDVARTLAFLLVDCRYKQPHKVVKYFVESGYQKRGTSRLDGRQLSALKGLTRFYMLHDLYKFLRHNPYEALPENEHFVRTRDFLLKDGIIKPTR